MTRDLSETLAYCVAVIGVIALLLSPLVFGAGALFGGAAAAHSGAAAGSAADQFYRGMFSLCMDVVNSDPQNSPPFSVGVAYCKLKVEKAKASKYYEAETPGWK